jgi:hypothetical protein
LPCIEIEGGEVGEAIDIFTLLNQEGKKITPDWILSAKTYSDSFRLGTLIDNILEELEQFNFSDKKPRETYVRELVFRSIQSSFGILYLDNKKTNVIELAKKPEFEKTVKRTGKSIIKAVKFLFEELLVVDSKLLPAGMQFSFLVEFFNHIDEPSDYQVKQLKDWFWITTFSNYFTIYNPSKRKEAFRVFRNYIKGKAETPLYNDKPNISFVVPDLPSKITLGSVRSKAHILFLLNYSNDFKPVDSENVEGFKFLKLLSHLNNGSEFQYIESANIVVMLDRFQKKINNQGLIFESLSPPPKKLKDFSYLLSYNVKNTENLFINDDIKLEYKNGRIEELLLLRESLIVKAERTFAKSLNLIYFDPF